MALDAIRRPRWCVPVVWAALGAAAIAFQVWAYGRWAAAGLHSAPFDSAQMPAVLRLTTRAEETLTLGGCALLLVIAWQQSRNAGHVTLAAALTAGYFLSVWSDPYSGTFRYAAANNRYAFNLVSWGPFLPGWQGPMPQIDTFLENAAYPFSMFWVWMGLGFSRLLRKLRSDWSRARIGVVTAAVCLICDIPMEQTYMRLGGYGYPRALSHLTLFEGQWYQLPVTSPLGMVFLVVMPVVLMALYVRQGQEVWLLEGSLDLSSRVQPWIRLLAGVGFVNVWILVYNLMMMLASLVSTPIPLPSWYQLPSV